jgi:Tat protein secretion system quality control protein TatD with DNase activity
MRAARTTLLLRHHRRHHHHHALPVHHDTARRPPSRRTEAAAAMSSDANANADADDSAARARVALVVASPPPQLTPAQWLLLADSHAHPQLADYEKQDDDDESPASSSSSSPFSAAAAQRAARQTLRRASAAKVACMSVGAAVDWDRVEALADLGGERIFPAFGIHPWWAHLHGSSGGGGGGGEGGGGGDDKEGAASASAEGGGGENADMRALLEAPDEAEMQAALLSVALAAAEGRLGIYGGGGGSEEEARQGGGRPGGGSGGQEEEEGGGAQEQQQQQQRQQATPSTAPHAPTLTLVQPIPRRDWEPRLRALLTKHPHAVVGELGLDRAAVIPGTRRARCSPQHQLALLQAQLSVAAELGRPVSVHCVRAHGMLYDELRLRAAASAAAAAAAAKSVAAEAAATAAAQPSPTPSNPTPTPSPPPRIPNGLPPALMMHSFGGSAEEARRFSGLEKVAGAAGCRVFFSFSAAINGRAGGEDKLARRIRAVPEDRLLLESDQVTPEALDAGLAGSLALVAAAKGWALDEAARRCRRNFDAFYGCCGGG